MPNLFYLLFQFLQRFCLFIFLFDLHQLFLFHFVNRKLQKFRVLPQFFGIVYSLNRLFVFFTLLIRIALILALKQLFSSIAWVMIVNIEIAILLVESIRIFLFGWPFFPVLQFLNQKTTTKLAFLSSKLFSNLFNLACTICESYCSLESYF